VKGGSEGIGPFDEMTLKTIDEYRTAINGAVRALWSGAIDVFDFSSMMGAAVRRGLRRAFEEGARESGIEPSEFTEAEIEAIDTLIANEIPRIDPFGDAIAENNQENGGKLSDFDWRVNLWVSRYGEAKALGQIMADTDQKYRWDVDAKESCRSCLRLAGKVKRASFWKEHDVYPRHHQKLECMIDAKGVPVCKCYFTATDEPLTRGPLPNLP
jgi:hypothetical protein